MGDHSLCNSLQSVSTTVTSKLFVYLPGIKVNAAHVVQDWAIFIQSSNRNWEVVNGLILMYLFCLFVC